ncbi:MAG: hypothetical protein NUW07_09940 [Candidatus Saccharicenans sp.]|nr:hypothetical protein [Candidatus Saccharicenans sp.]
MGGTRFNSKAVNLEPDVKIRSDDQPFFLLVNFPDQVFYFLVGFFAPGKNYGETGLGILSWGFLRPAVKDHGDFNLIPGSVGGKLHQQKFPGSFQVSSYEASNGGNGVNQVVAVDKETASSFFGSSVLHLFFSSLSERNQDFKSSASSIQTKNSSQRLIARASTWPR